MKRQSDIISVNNNMEKISFVKGKLIKVKNRQELDTILNSCNHYLTGYDLRDVDLSNVDFHDFRIDDVVFNVFDVKSKVHKEIFNVNFKGCIMNRVSFAHCSFNRCNFDSYTTTCVNDQGETHKEDNITTINHCDFFFSQFTNCRFKNTKICVADFRYSSLTDCSMGYFNISYGDFYMTSFHGTTNFTHAAFKLCSITNATFENHCLLMENIDKLIQEDYYAYSNILMHQENWIKQNPCADFSSLNKAEDEKCEIESRIYIAREAQHIYTLLSGLYSGKGFFKDSNLAYAMAKNNEALFYKLRMKKDWDEKEICNLFKDLQGWLDPSIARALGYGFKVVPVLGICFILILLFWWFLLVFDHPSSWDNGLAYSICNTMGPYFDHISEIYHLIAGIESALGILLVGFLGFVIANRIRNNS